MKWLSGGSTQRNRPSILFEEIKKIVIGIDLAILSICPDTMKSSKSLMLKFAPL